MSDYYKTWYAKNKEHKLEQNRAWRNANIEKVREYDREYKRKMRHEAKASQSQQTAPSQSDAEITTA